MVLPVMYFYFAGYVCSTDRVHKYITVMLTYSVSMTIQERYYTARTDYMYKCNTRLQVTFCASGAR